MAKAKTLTVTFDNAYAFAGKVYGPGVDEIDEALLDGNLSTTPAFRVCIDKAREATKPAEDEPVFANHPLSFYAGKSDDEIEAVDNVGKGTLAKIKAALAERK